MLFLTIYIIDNRCYFSFIILNFFIQHIENNWKKNEKNVYIIFNVLYWGLRLVHASKDYTFAVGKYVYINL